VVVPPVSTNGEQETRRRSSRNPDPRS